MFIDSFPKFEEGRILKREMLEELRDYPRSFVEIHYQNYADGIISGANLNVSDSKIIVEKGIIKYKGIVYLLKSETEIKYEDSLEETAIIVRFLEDETQDFKILRGSIELEKCSNLEGEYLELGRFNLEKGAFLRDSYRDFFDLETGYNTLNIVNVLYSCSTGDTIHPKITTYFCQEMTKRGISDSWDINFVMTGLSQNPISRQIIEIYIREKLKIDEEDMDNSRIYNCLCKILQESGRIARSSENVRKRPPKIIVD